MTFGLVVGDLLVEAAVGLHGKDLSVKVVAGSQSVELAEVVLLNYVENVF